MPTSDPKRSGNPARRAASGSSARPAAASRAFVQRSAAILQLLTRLPRYLIPAIVLVLMLVGLSAPLPFAVPALLLVFAVVGWLAYLSWPVIPRRGRIIRGAMIALLALAVWTRVFG